MEQDDASKLIRRVIVIDDVEARATMACNAFTRDSDHELVWIAEDPLLEFKRRGAIAFLDASSKALSIREPFVPYLLIWDVMVEDRDFIGLAQYCRLVESSPQPWNHTFIVTRHIGTAHEAELRRRLENSGITVPPSHIFPFLDRIDLYREEVVAAARKLATIERNRQFNKCLCVGGLHDEFAGP